MNSNENEEWDFVRKDLSYIDIESPYNQEHDENTLYALNYVEAGFAVFPVKKGDKTPLLKNGCNGATKDPETVKQWWDSTYKGANIGIATGAISGIFVVDADKDKGGLQSLEALNLPHTLTANTGGGGKHLAYNYPRCHVGNSTSKIAAGIDIRGDGGYIVAAPSLHKSGNKYSWEDGSAPISDAPDWLLKKITEPSKPDLKSVGKELVIEEGQRNDRLFREACTLRAMGWESDTILTSIMALNSQQCKPPLSDDEILSIVLSASKYDPNESPENKAISIAGKLFSETDVGNAKLLVKYHGDKIRYCPQRGLFFLWDNKRWCADDDQGVARLYIDTIEKMEFNDFQTDLSGKHALAAFIRHKKQSQNRGRLKAALEVTTFLKDIIVNSSQLDNKPNLINLANGTFDLETFKLREFKKEDYLTEILPYDYNPSAKCHRFRKFVDEIMLGDQSLTTYLQKLMGYCKSGSTSEESVFIYYGDGANGKSTLIEVQRHLSGGYAKATPFNTFVSTRGERIRNDIAALAGARFVSAVEVEEDRQLDEAVIKQLTGADTISARYLFKEYFEFKPQFKVVLSVNRLPQIRGTDNGIWRRIKVLPFKAVFPNEARDPYLLKKLLQELSGIFNWAIEGYKLWKEEGLAEPEKVKQAIGAYRQSMDSLSRFIELRCTAGKGNELCSFFHSQYEDWCRDEMVRQLNRSQLVAAMESKGFGRKKIKGNYHYDGITILTNF